MPGERRPTIVLFGNCQSTIIGRFLYDLPELRERFRFARYRNYTDAPALPGFDDTGEARSGSAADFIRKHRGEIAAFIGCRTHDWASADIASEDLGPHMAVVRYPAAALSYLWPFSYRPQDRVGDDVELLFPYTIMDSLLRDLIERGVGADRIVQEYLAIDITKLARLDRLREINARSARQIEARSDFGIWDHVESRIGEERVFRTENHPNGPLMARIIGEICARLPFISDSRMVEHQLTKIRAGAGVVLLDAAVHPQVAAHFKLQWAIGGRHRFWNEGYDTFEERLLRLYHGNANANLRHADAALQRGEVAQAIGLYRLAAAELPQSAHVRHTLAQCLIRTGEVEAAIEPLRAAYALEPTGDRAVRIVTALLKLRRTKEAQSFLAAAAEELPGDPELPVAQIMIERARESRWGLRRALNEGDAKAPMDFRVHLYRGDWHRGRREYDQAAARYERAAYLSGWNALVRKRQEALRERVEA
jgi:hypothetical protein